MVTFPVGDVTPAMLLEAALHPGGAALLETGRPRHLTSRTSRDHRQE